MKLSKLNFSSFPTFVLTMFLFVLGASILSSCGGKKHSVRDMRDARAPYIPKPQERAMIQPLFLQSKKPNIFLPANIAAAVGGSIVTEQVTYTNQETKSDLFDAKDLDLSKTYGLQEVIVEARSRFTPERNGKIDIDFVVRVPKELIDRNWMIKMQPYIVHDDSLQMLDRVIVKGQQFALKQKMDYQSYQDYLNSIVAKEDYDSVFLDHKLIAQDIKERQEYYYNEYHRVWAPHVEYENWLAEQKEKDAKEKAILKGKIAEVRYTYKRNLLAHAVRDVARGIDTTGLAASYNMEFLRKSSGLQKQLDKIETGQLDIPKRYKEIHAMRTGSKDVENFTMTIEDTLQIAKNRYKIDAIIENETKEARKEIVKKEMIPFPYDEKARLDSTLAIGQNFTYLFKQTIPVTPGLKSVNIAMGAQVIALDNSKYNMLSSDTLSYFISSVTQLVDTTLLHKETVRNRNAATRQTAYFQYRPATWRFDPQYKDNAAELAKIIKDYDTFEDSKAFTLDSIFLQLATSLDGEFHKNADLSMRRIEDFKKHLLSSTKMRNLQSSFLTTNYIGEDWKGLVRLLKERNDITNKDAILDILGNANEPDKAKAEIQSLYKEDFDIIKREIYPKLDRIDVVFFAHRTDMTNDRETITVDPEYIKGVRHLQNREYSEAMEILVNYPDYNAAVGLAALGYNAKAYEVLVKQKPNGNTEYLSAIVAWRLEQPEAAINHLMKAIELDPSKLYRLELDPDIVDMIDEHQLQSRINQIHAK